jgi:hypothetical protein
MDDEETPSDKQIAGSFLPNQDAVSNLKSRDIDDHETITCQKWKISFSLQTRLMS